MIINRLYQRELIARMDEIEQLEKRWNCKIDFPNTEQASDVVTISGPEYQVPQALDAFLVSVDVFSVPVVSTPSLTASLFRGWFRRSTKLHFRTRTSCRLFSPRPSFPARCGRPSESGMRSMFTSMVPILRPRHRPCQRRSWSHPRRKSASY